MTDQPSPYSAAAPFKVSDLDLDQSATRVIGQISVNHSRAAVEATVCHLRERIRELEAGREALVEQTRRDIYKNILAGLGVDYDEDASAMTLLLKVNAEIERAAEIERTAETHEAAQVLVRP